MNSKNKFRAAVIGLGNIGFLFDLDQLRSGTWSHVAAYKKNEYVELVGAVEVDEKKIALFRERYKDVPVFRDIHNLMLKCTPDIVSICTPTGTHYTIFEELIQYPLKAIFCEKPLSYNIEEATTMVHICDEKGIVFAVNHTRRWDDHYLYVREIIHNNEIGTVKAVNMNYPGQVFNIGTHLLDTLRMLSGKEIISISGISAEPNKDDPDISGWLQFEDNTFGSINSSGKRENLVFEFDFIGDKGRVKIEDNGETIKKYIFDESARYSGYYELKLVEIRKIERQDRFIKAISDIVKVIEGNKKKVNCTGYDGLLDLKLVLALIESSRRKGSPVMLS